MPVNVGHETLEVIQKSRWAGEISGGVFDITFQALAASGNSGAAEANPKPPAPAAVAAAKEARRLSQGRGRFGSRNGKCASARDEQIGLGGIAKGYAVDLRRTRAARRRPRELPRRRRAAIFTARDRSRTARAWVSGIQDPRAPQGHFFATIELKDHAFSTAGDYARAYFVERQALPPHHRSAHRLPGDGVSQRDRLGARRVHRRRHRRRRLHPRSRKGPRARRITRRRRRRHRRSRTTRCG